MYPGSEINGVPESQHKAIDLFCSSSRMYFDLTSSPELSLYELIFLPFKSISIMFINFLKTLVSSANKTFTFCNTLIALNVKSESVPIGVEIRYKAGSNLGKFIFNFYNPEEFKYFYLFYSIVQKL